MGNDPAGDVQQAVTDPFRLGDGELAFEAEQPDPAEQVLGDQRELQPGLVVRERVVGQVAHAGVLAVADAVLDPGALTVAHLQAGDINVGLVGDESRCTGSRARRRS